MSASIAIFHVFLVCFIGCLPPRSWLVGAVAVAGCLLLLDSGGEGALAPRSGIEAAGTLISNSASFVL